MNETVFYILMALADGERHGYSVIKEVERSTDGTVRLLTGTLYRLLKQMTLDGWIVESDRVDEHDQRRRYYRLTPRGKEVAQAEAQRLTALLRLAQARDLLP